MRQAPRTTEFLAVNGIVVRERLRALKQEIIADLANSMSAVGMRTPISVRMTSEEDGYDAILVTGHHRLEAARHLGWGKIECFVVETENEFDARKWEIAENLHRADLTALERRKHIKEWMDLVQAGFDTNSCQNPRGGRPKDGVRAASRELGIDRGEAERSHKIGSMSSAAQEAAIETGLDRNESALELAARKPEHEQEPVIRAIAAAGTVTAFKAAADPSSDAQALEKQVAKLMAAWNAACPDARQEFLGRIGQPIMDRQYA